MLFETESWPTHRSGMALARENFPKKDVDRRCARRDVPPSFVAGWSSLVARQAHNLKVVGSNPTPAPNLKPPETAPGGFCLMTCAIFERATSRVQPQSTRGNFWTPKPNIEPNIFRAKNRLIFLRPSGAPPEFLPLRINKKATFSDVAQCRNENRF